MAIKKWKQLSSKVLLEHPRLTVYEDTVALPDGQQTTYVRFGDTANAATVIAVRDGTFLVQREYSYPPNEVIWQWPGGGVPFTEDIAIGANRELTEEAGFEGDIRIIGEYLVNNRRSAAKMYFCVATNIRQVPANPEPHEFLEHHWLRADEIDKIIDSGNASNPHFMAGWVFYKKYAG